MSCCCIKTLNLCNFGVCEVLEIKQVIGSGSGGPYTLLLDYLGNAIRIIQDQVAGENIKFNLDILNENFEYTGQIFDLNGDLVNIIDNSISYDCIKFRTIIRLSSLEATSSPILKIPNSIIIQDVIGQPAEITGTTKAVTGLDAGSNTITCDDFVGVRILLTRGSFPCLGYDAGDGNPFYLKALNSNYITLSKPLAEGEQIILQTIPY